MLSNNINDSVWSYWNEGLFYYYGDLLEVTDYFVKIKMNIGYKQINIDEIIEIKKARRK